MQLTLSLYSEDMKIKKSYSQKIEQKVSRNVTMNDIAKVLNISKSAVSLAFANSTRISDELKKEIFKTAEKLGYKKNNLLSEMMSEIKKGMTTTFSENIALLNGNYDQNAFVKHPTLPIYISAIRDEATKLGYATNDFWLMDPTLSAKKLASAFRTRGIRGGLVLGHNFGNSIPNKFDEIWKEFYFISIGIKMQNPKLEMVSADNYAIARLATSKAIEYGYKRPALVLDPLIDNLVDGTFLAAFLREQYVLPIKNRISPFLKHESEKDFERKFAEWINKNKPDAIIHLTDSSGKVMRAVLDKIKYKVKFIQLERRSIKKNWTGVEQNNDLVGRIAIHRLADALRMKIPNIGTYDDTTTFIPPTWVDDSSDKKSK